MPWKWIALAGGLVLLVVFAGFLAVFIRQSMCTEGRLEGEGYTLSLQAYGDAMANAPGLAATRKKLKQYIRKEPTCVGRHMLAVEVAMIDINEAELPKAAYALQWVLEPQLPEDARARMVDRLIGRYERAGDLATAVSYARAAVGMFPARDYFRAELALLLAADGQQAEARTIAEDLYREAVPRAPKGHVPYAGWVLLSVAEASGDASFRQDVLAMLNTRLGEAGEDAGAPDYTALMEKRADPGYVSQPSTELHVVYPEQAARQGLEGSCTVTLDVARDGTPQNVRADCTDDVFVLSSERAVATGRFWPFLEAGRPKPVSGVTYPLEYRLQR